MQIGTRRRAGRPAALRWLLHRSCALLAFWLFLLASKDANAYPSMIKHGYTNCAGCHADPSGGELLTVYGHAISYEVLSTQFGGKSEGAQAFAKRRAMAALRRAAVAKSARKAIRAEKVVLDEEAPAPKRAAKKPTKKPPPAAAAPAPAEEQPAPDADTEPAEAAEADPDAAAEKPKRKVKKKVDEEAEEEETEATEEETEAAKPKKKRAKKQAVDEEETEEEGASEEADADSEATGTGSSATVEPSPYEGMSGLTGPLFGLMKPNEKLLLGGSFRFATTLTPETRVFPMQMDLYGQARFGERFRAGLSLGVAKVPAGSPHARAAQVTQNQGNGYNLISRTHWVGADFGDGTHTVRAGRLNLPFGLRMSEHVMWVREKTQTDRESDQQHGVSLYMAFETFRFEVMGIAGNFQVNPDQFRERGYSGYGEFVLGEKTALGVSSLYTIAGNDRVYTEGLKTSRQAHGVFVRSAVTESVVLLAELDGLLRTRRELGYVGFFQIDYEAIQGLHFIGTGELLDAGYPKGGGLSQTPRAKGFGKPEVAGWLSAQWFFLPHFDFRIDSIFRSDTQIMAQIHVYL